ncbi:hypothetical protein K435DRAFT_958926 [Dendrothele bispora CBS 962.96]|uniref:Uncharacterized protein n=1 Tax=Dendrothele bispora (strain CBS 962.96) TaxID=1314807 RepID=A0A4S8N0F8_DENBC|nr:hypothetical protein K435DRAFT_958926 [Dendrothele bispora CBS 962.96]
MDDDITFGASVWGSNEPVNILPPAKSASSPPSESAAAINDEFDDFDDFGPPTDQIAPIAVEDDDFGDFGDFGDAQEMATPMGFSDDAGFTSQAPVAGPSRVDWQPLRLDPLPSKSELAEEINEILDSLWDDNALSAVTTKDGIRELEGVNQILVTNESRELYTMLFRTPPATKPPNWTRSRIRRQHLISLGIPVNLDEVLPHANGKPLPPLQITTRPMSAPPGPRNSPRNSSAPASASQSRSSSPLKRSGHNQFGPKPQLDEARISQLLELDQDNLRLQPLSVLERQLTEIRAQTASTSALLTYLLQMRDALQQDSETYNGLIAELVGEAQRIKTGSKGRNMVLNRTYIRYRMYLHAEALNAE